GTVTPAANTARSTPNSCGRERLAGTPVGESVRRTSRCGAPSKLASNPQFCWIAPPSSRAISPISTVRAPLASARNRASRSDRGDAVAAIDRDHRAGHIGARRGRKKQQGAAEILDLADPLHRHPRGELQAGLAFEEVAVEIGHDIAGRNRVDEDVVP